MDEKTRQELEAAHRQAMEGIKAFNKEAKAALEVGKDMLGVK